MPTRCTLSLATLDLKSDVETQPSMQKSTLKVTSPTLRAAPLQHQAGKSPGKEILLADSEGLQMSLFLNDGAKMLGALWNYLSQLTFLTSPSDRCTCPSYSEELLFDNDANFIILLLHLWCKEWELKISVERMSLKNYCVLNMFAYLDSRKGKSSTLNQLKKRGGR